MVNKTNTYAWITDTIISNNVIKIIITKGKTHNDNTEFNNILKAKPDNIANNKWPAEIFAAKRTPKEIARIIKLIVSIITKKGANAIGTPPGIKILKKFNLKVIKPNNITTINMDRDKPNVTIICAVGVKTNGNNPKILEMAINIKMHKIKGKNFCPDFPKFSWTINLILIYTNSIKDCHLFGINLSLFLNKPQTTIATTTIITREFVIIKAQSFIINGSEIKLIILNCSKYPPIIII